MEIIHVCFSLFDKYGKYAKYLGTAILSMLENTNSHICIHILNDCSLSRTNVDKLRCLVHAFNQDVRFYPLSMPCDMYNLGAISNFTIGTLFRLKIADIISQEISKIIYFDADLLFSLDVMELWNLDLGKNNVLAVKDQGFHPASLRSFFDKRILDKEKYFNAGVMILNLSEIRRTHDLFEESLFFLRKYPYTPFMDQDALNFIFFHEVGFISKKYNFFTLQNRHKDHKLKHKIYHFAGDHAHMLPEESFDEFFFDTLFRTPWGDKESICEYYMDGLKLRDKQIQILRQVFSFSRNRSLVFWGAAGMSAEMIMSYCQIDTNRDFIVDSNPSLQDNIVHGMLVKSTDAIKTKNNGIYVIVLSNLHYEQIKMQLLSWGYKENEDFIDGRWILLEHEYGHFVI